MRRHHDVVKTKNFSNFEKDFELLFIVTIDGAESLWKLAPYNETREA